MNRPYGHKPEASKDRVVDYRIEAGESVGELENKVNSSLKEGWELRGELVSEPSSFSDSGSLLDSGYLFQVMVRSK